MITAIGALAVLSTSHPVRGADLEDQVTETIASFKLADPGITNFFSNSAGYVVFPNISEGGFIIGAERGKGLLMEKDKTEATAKVTLTAVSVGAQVGGGSFSQVIFLQDSGALKSFKEGQLTMAADAKATVAASGASANAKYQQGVAVFALPKSGAMVSASVGGQKFKVELIP